MADDGMLNSSADDGRTEEGGERRGEGGRRKEEGGRRKEEGGRIHQEGGVRNEVCGEKVEFTVKKSSTLSVLKKSSVLLFFL